MEAMGLVARINRWGGAKTTHVQLTDTGRALAEHLAAEQEAALAAMLEGMTIEIPPLPCDCPSI
jgi:DNA-binding MarR family transcriptional regulator